ncbi:Mannosylfructose-phosphate phosphatase [Pirellula sp. SH-Sr6A]|uniref:HAD-IIB family hydrolase n=1 Tax=Pirellula sp. SH-Sr6A TaxID=1632865 RepID=UPI00078C048A|nr:HAD-IIB family hydrolase [Pirellula sp. SH-Sr6A]AMV35040.1 Mannosylfructose-phosphate phosphatase [Pirellula sp. SH-Sr6A]
MENLLPYAPALPNPRALATDLDGTLIPLPETETHQADLLSLKQLLEKNRIPLVFATGRHLASIITAIDAFSLPIPDCIIADVGTTIYERTEKGWAPIISYAHHLAASLDGVSLLEIEQLFQKYDALTLQSFENQSRFKLSYECSQDSTFELAKHLQLELDSIAAPYAITASLAPFATHGLIDVLPRSASKASALRWWAQQMGWDFGSLLFAGDSGNDLAALTSGFRSILVANADPELVEQVKASHQIAGWNDRLYIAKQSATSGVLEGCRWFGVI